MMDYIWIILIVAPIFYQFYAIEKLIKKSNDENKRRFDVIDETLNSMEGDLWKEINEVNEKLDKK